MSTENGGASMPRATLTEKEAAAYLGLSPSTMRRRRAAGRPPRFLKMGSSIRYTKQDLDRYIEFSTRGGVMPERDELTADRVRELLDFDGTIAWRQRPAGHVHVSGRLVISIASLRTVIAEIIARGLACGSLLAEPSRVFFDAINLTPAQEVAA